MRYAALILHFWEKKWRFNCKSQKGDAGAAPKLLKITIEIAAAMVYPIEVLGRKPFCRRKNRAHRWMESLKFAEIIFAQSLAMSGKVSYNEQV